MSKKERSPKTLAPFAQNICEEDNSWLIFIRKFGITGSFSSESTRQVGAYSYSSALENYG